MNAPRRNCEVVSSGNKELKPVSTTSLDTYGKLLFASFLAGIVALSANDAEADPVIIDNEGVPVAGGNVHTVEGGISFFAPDGVDLHEITSKKEREINCARGFVAPVRESITFCIDSGEQFVQVDFGDGVESIYIREDYWLQDMLFLSFGHGFEIYLTGDVNSSEYVFMDYNLVPDMTQLPFGFTFDRMTPTKANVLVNHGDNGQILIRVDSEKGINVIDYSEIKILDRSESLPGSWEAENRPFVIENGESDKIITFFRNRFTDEIFSVEDITNDLDREDVSSIENVGLRSMNWGRDIFRVIGVMKSDDDETIIAVKRENGEIEFLKILHNPPIDTDQDGVPDETDNCIDDANLDQLDTDNDGVGDVCDNCPENANANQDPEVCEIVVVEDRDNDDIPDDLDNCINNANSDQADLDEDGLGDACDPDIDGDGVLNDQDQCPRTHDGSIGIGAGSEGDGCPIDDPDTGTGDAGNDIIEDTNTTPDTNIDADTGIDTGTTTPDTNIEEDTGSVEPDVPEADTNHDAINQDDAASQADITPETTPPTPPTAKEPSCAISNAAPKGKENVPAGLVLGILAVLVGVKRRKR